MAESKRSFSLLEMIVGAEADLTAIFSHSMDCVHTVVLLGYYNRLTAEANKFPLTINSKNYSLMSFFVISLIRLNGATAMSLSEDKKS